MDKCSSVDASFLAECESFFYFEDNLTDQLTEWAKSKSHTFVNKDPRSVEQPLEHTSIHAEFCALFEDLFTDFLARNSVSVPEFYNLLKQEQAQARRGHGQLPISATFGNVLLSVTDFFNFCEMMYEVETGSEVIFCPPLVLVDDMVESAPKLDDWDRVEVQAKVEEKGFYSPAKVTAKSSYK